MPAFICSVAALEERREVDFDFGASSKCLYKFGLKRRSRKNGQPD